MNLAVQKRHEQLERWRQIEADVESRLQQVEKSHPTSYNSSIQKIKFKKSASSGDISFLSKYRSKSNENEDEPSIEKIEPVDTGPRAKKRISKSGRLIANLRVDFTNSTLFLTACANGDIQECERLLKERKVDINTTTTDGLTGLHEAAICGNAEMVEFLINRGANINCCDNEGWTPLHAASSLGQTKIVQMLLDLGADARIVNCENFLAYDLARNDQVKEIIGEHLQGVDIDELRNQEELAMARDIERWLKTGKYDERSHPLTNATVLHVLAAKGHVKLMKKILESPTLKKQINLEAKDNEGYTPLLAASFWSQTEVVELLIEHGANIFAQANNGYKISSFVSFHLDLFLYMLLGK